MTLGAQLMYRFDMSKPFHPLQPGEAIGVVALSGPVDADRLTGGLEVLRSWGHPLLLAPNLGDRIGYLAGDDEVRLAGLEWALDQGARFLMAARGGYGATRLLERVPWRRLVESQTTFVGFSDLTAIMNVLIERGGAVQVHGPMVAAGLSRRRNNHRLHALIRGERIDDVLFRFQKKTVVRRGCVCGPARGGNLAMMTSLLGTPFEVDLKGCVLFLEEVGEPLYRLDRMLTQLSSSATFREVKALICGSLRGCGPAKSRAEIWRRLVAEVAPSGAPVIVDQAFGHGVDNRAFPIGAMVEVDTDAGVVRWRP
jgi:muramoyltetrapeptide carboxypeptidase